MIRDLELGCVFERVPKSPCLKRTDSSNRPGGNLEPGALTLDKLSSLGHVIDKAVPT